MKVMFKLISKTVLRNGLMLKFVYEEILNYNLIWSKLGTLSKKIFNLFWIFEFETSFIKQAVKVTWYIGNL